LAKPGQGRDQACADPLAMLPVARCRPCRGSGDLVGCLLPHGCRRGPHYIGPHGPTPWLEKSLRPEKKSRTSSTARQSRNQTENSPQRTRRGRAATKNDVTKGRQVFAKKTRIYDLVSQRSQRKMLLFSSVNSVVHLFFAARQGPTN
jgi:hypothetical protein